MRIAFFLGGSDLGRSGIGVYVREVLPRLAALAEGAGDGLVVTGTQREHAAFDTAALPVERRTLPSIFDSPGPSALLHLGATGALALCAGADVALLPAANRRIGSISVVPTVAVVHDLAQLTVRGKYDALRMAYVRYAVMSALRRASVLVAVSNATRDDLATSLGRPPQSIRVVPNGVDADRFRPMGRRDPRVLEALSAHSIHAPYLLYVSRLEHPGKNHLRLIRAFARCAVRPTHELLLVGADWGALEAIEAVAAEEGVADRVRWLGFVPDHELPALTAAADAVVMVGLREGFGLPALEAIAAGRPVCASNTGALPEVVGPHARLCDPEDERSIGDALEAVVMDGALRQRAREDGPAWAAARGWQATAEGLYEACRVARAHRSPPQKAFRRAALPTTVRKMIRRSKGSAQ
jgi:glycosyltransferase involved in cell wall biosynthesis